MICFILRSVLFNIIWIKGFHMGNPMQNVTIWSTQMSFEDRVEIQNL